jgi:hypothetical protein
MESNARSSHGDVYLTGNLVFYPKFCGGVRVVMRLSLYSPSSREPDPGVRFTAPTGRTASVGSFNCRQSYLWLLDRSRHRGATPDDTVAVALDFFNRFPNALDQKRRCPTGHRLIPL